MVLIILFIYACLGMACCAKLFEVSRRSGVLQEHDARIQVVTGGIIIAFWPIIFSYAVIITLLDVRNKS